MSEAIDQPKRELSNQEVINTLNDAWSKLEMVAYDLRHVAENTADGEISNNPTIVRNSLYGVACRIAEAKAEVWQAMHDMREMSQ